MMCLVFEEMPSPDLSASPSPPPPPIPHLTGPCTVYNGLRCTTVVFITMIDVVQRMIVQGIVRMINNTLWERRGVARVAKHLSSKGTQR